MRKIVSLALALALALSLSAALAADPVDITTSITPNLPNVMQGQTLLLTATSLVDSGNATFVSEAWTGATVQSPASGSGASFTSTALFSAVGKAPGQYNVTYTITVSRGNSSNTASDDDLEIVTVVENQVIEVTAMAAPAVAAKILSFNGVNPGYKNGKLAGNFIADVAAEMGPQTLFHGIPKAGDDGFSNPAYRQEVLDFLNAHPRIPKTLLLPPASYFD